MSEPEFKEGDEVVVNKGTIATIVRYDEGADRWSAKARVAGGGYDEISGHISNTHFELLAAQPLASLHADAPKASTRDSVSNDSVKTPKATDEK